MKYCTQCGAAISDEALFCTACGAKQNGIPAPVADVIPAVEEAPVAVETPAVEEAPVAVETPAVEEAPVAVETPAVEEAPVADVVPMVEAAPVAVEASAVEAIPMTAEIPVVAAVPAVAEVPAQPVQQAPAAPVAAPQKNPAALWLVLNIVMSCLFCCNPYTFLLSVEGWIFGIVGMKAHKVGNIGRRNSTVLVSKVMFFTALGIALVGLLAIYGVVQSLISLAGGMESLMWYLEELLEELMY